MKILAGLARYHSFRLLAGVSFSLYQQTGNRDTFDDAIASERQALEAWKQMVEAAGDVYNRNLAFGAHAVGFSRHWEEGYSLLGRDFEKLLAERTAASSQPGSRHFTPRSALPAPPAARLYSEKTARPGSDYLVFADVSVGVKSVRLRYRHVTQVEDYQTAEMTLDSKTGKYVGRIPAAFIDPTWDLMYFVEIIGMNHSGRMYPDADTETPYIVATVQR